MSVVSPLASVDWQTVAAAIATLAGTLYLTLKGAQKGKKKAEDGKPDLTGVVGASLIEAACIQNLTHQLHENTQALNEKARALRENTAAIQRNTDITIMTHHK